MLIAIESRDNPVCEIIRRNLPDSGVAFLPAVSVRYELEPAELKLQHEIGRLCFGMARGLPQNMPTARPDEAARQYRMAADFPQNGERTAGFDETA